MIASNTFVRFMNRCRSLLGWIPRIESGPGRGLRFEVGPATSLFLSGKYEGPVQEAISALVRKGNVFYDIGANTGFFSLLAGRLVGPSGKVYAFEPVPGNAAIVEKNVRLNRFANIAVLKVALTDQIGKAELLLADHAGGAVLKGSGTPLDLTSSIMVETNSVDSLVQAGQILPPDVVKIDVEGAEMAVLRGMVKVLEKTGPTIIVEVDDETQTKCEAKLAACRSFLEDFNYKTEVLLNSYTDGKWFVRHLLGKRQSANMTIRNSKKQVILLHGA